MGKVFFVAATRVSLSRPSRTTIWAGTLEELKNQVFGYTLECGASWSSKVSRNPKTIKSLISNLNKAREVTCRSYQDEFFNLATEEQINLYKEHCGDNLRGSYTIPNN